MATASTPVVRLILNMIEAVFILTIHVGFIVGTHRYGRRRLQQESLPTAPWQRIVRYQTGLMVLIMQERVASGMEKSKSMVMFCDVSLIVMLPSHLVRVKLHEHIQ